MKHHLRVHTRLIDFVIYNFIGSRSLQNRIKVLITVINRAAVAIIANYHRTQVNNNKLRIVLCE